MNLGVPIICNLRGQNDDFGGTNYMEFEGTKQWFWGTKRVSKFPQCLFPGQPRSWKLQATSLWALNLESSHPIHWNKTNGFLYIGVFHFSSLLISKVPVMARTWFVIISKCGQCYFPPGLFSKAFPSLCGPWNITCTGTKHTKERLTNNK